MVELLDDAALARRLLGSVSGDSAGEEELCRRFAPRIRLYGLRHLRDGDAADDLVQEVLVRVVEAIRGKRVTDPQYIAGFVLGTCRHVVWNARRVDARRQRVLNQHRADVLKEWQEPEPEVDLHRLTGCLETLPQREREILFLTFYEEQEAQAIADRLGLTPGHVRVIRHRALADIRRCLGGEQPGSEAAGKHA